MIDVLGLFPPGSLVDDEGELVVGGCRLTALAEEFGTPVMVVAEDAVRQRARDYLAAFRNRWPRSDVAFASKAFPCTAIQRLMAEEGLLLDVAGGGEIVTGLAAGADPARMVLHGNAKTDEDLEMAIHHGVGLVVVDNEDDIDRLERIVAPGRRQPCLVRVIPGIQADTYAAVATGHAGSKFGLDPEAARAAITRIRRSRRLRCDGARILVEPGRSMTAAAACTVYRVTTVKRGEVTHVAIDGGMGDNLEVSLYGQRFEATVVNRVGGGDTVNVVGRHCESGDHLIDGVPLQDPVVGDLLAVPVTGAYCYTMSNQYNGARRIPVVLVSDGNPRLVVRRDTWDDLLARDVPFIGNPL